MERAKVRVRWAPAIGIAGLVATLALLPAGLAADEPEPEGSEFQVNTYTTSTQTRPSVSSEDGGDFVVTWTSYGSSGTDNSSLSVQGQRYASDGTPQGGEFQVNTFTYSTQDSSSVSSDADGDFVVVWHDTFHDGASTGVFGQRYASDGTPQGVHFQVNSFTIGVQQFPQVSSDADRDFVVVWEGNTNAVNDPNFAISGQRYASDGTPQGTEFLVNTYTTDSQRAPSVSSDGDGDFVVVWHSNLQDGSNYGIFGQRYASNGTPQGGEFQVNTFTTGNQLNPSVSSDADGDFVVVWSGNGSGGDPFGIHGQRYASNGTPQGGEFQVNTYTTGFQSLPEVSSDADGDFVVAWESDGQDGSGNSVQGQRFTSDGTPNGSQFEVNTYTTSDQIRPSVSAAANGDFVVAWQSSGSDGTDTDGTSIQGQRYSVGPCHAEDGENLVLSDDTVMGTEVYEVCDTLTTGPNYEVAGPNGDLTLRAGVAVVMEDGTSVGTDGSLTVEIDPSL